MANFKIALVCGIAALPALVHAQSAVTIYGRVDLSVNTQRFSATPTRPAASLNAISSDTSLWGLRGSEDLGGGMRAYFKLENGFQADTGAQSNPTTYWNRETYVGLSHPTWGALQLGSQFAPVIFMSARTDPFQRANIGAQFTLLQGPPRGYAVQYNNAIQYITPNWSGFTGRVLASLAEGGPGTQYGASLEYVQGKLTAGLSYDAMKVAGSTVALAAPAVDSRTVAAAATYDLTAVKLHGWFQSNDIQGLPRVNGYQVGATVPVSAQGNVRAAFSRRNASTGDAALISVGYFHNLSKRTMVYGSVGRLKNDGAAAFGMWPARAEAAAQGFPGAGQGVTGLQLGMRHMF